MTLSEIYSLDNATLYQRCIEAMGAPNGSLNDALSAAVDWLSETAVEPFNVTHNTRRPPEMRWVIRLGGGGSYLGYGQTFYFAVMRSVLIVSGWETHVLKEYEKGN